MAENNNRVAGREVTLETVKRMSNCRLKWTRNDLLTMLEWVEEEMERRMGQGGGGLKNED